MSPALRASTVLFEIERHAVWVYGAGLELAQPTPFLASAARRERLIARILHTSEALRDLLPRVPGAGLDPDEAVDVAVVLRCALETWERARVAWQGDQQCHAVTTALAELTEIGDAVGDVLASLSNPRDDSEILTMYESCSRKVQ